MSNHRPRDYSPPRYQMEQPRSTTGNVYATPFDTASRVGPPSQSKGSVSSTSSGRHSVAYQAQPLRQTTASDGKVTTAYTVRPKDGPYDDLRRPLYVNTGNHSPPRRNSAIMASPRQTTPAVMRDNSSRFLQPAPSHGHYHGSNHRHNSTSMSELPPRNDHSARRDKSYHSRQTPYGQKVYHDARPPLREDDQWSYTGPREQFHRDYPQRSRDQRDAASRKERPINDYEADRPPVKRDPAPLPSSSRHPSTRERRGSERYSGEHGFDSEPERASDAPRKRDSTRQPVVHQQARDDGYSSARDNHESGKSSRHRSSRHADDFELRDRHREAPREYHRSHRERNRDDESERNTEYDRKYHQEPDHDRRRHGDRGYGREYDREERAQDTRRKPGSRDSSPERSGLKALAGTALGGMAAAGIAKGLNRDHKEKDSDSDEIKERRRRKHRRPSRTDEQYQEGENDDGQRKDDKTRSRKHESSGSETQENGNSRRRRSHRRREEDDKPSNGKAVSPDEHDDRRALALRPREQRDSSPDPDRSSRELVPVRSQDSELLETRTMSPGENEDDRPRRVQLVEPIKDREEKQVRSILKPARQVPFPEDPNPVREGVAPLKDATKEGIPPNARWTKISRVLVNPEALEKSHERFEERDEYMIVLRVLSKEEIRKLADKTKEIRAEREREWKEKFEEQQRQAPGSADRQNNGEGEIDYNRENDESRPPLAIEQGPPAPPADFYDTQNASDQPPASKVPKGGPPVPDVDVEATYSQNV